MEKSEVMGIYIYITCFYSDRMCLFCACLTYFAPNTSEADRESTDWGTRSRDLRLLSGEPSKLLPGLQQLRGVRLLRSAEAEDLDRWSSWSGLQRG